MMNTTRMDTGGKGVKRGEDSPVSANSGFSFVAGRVYIYIIYIYIIMQLMRTCEIPSPCQPPTRSDATVSIVKVLLPMYIYTYVPLYIYIYIALS